MAKTKSVPHNDVTVMSAPDTSTTEITPHEIVTELPPPARLTPEQQAQQEIQKFDIPRAWISQKKEEYKDLKIADESDKAGYKKVEAAWQEVRTKRIATEKKREEIKAGYLLIGKKIDGEAKDLVSLLKEVEDPLNNELERIDNLKKEAAAELERQAQKKLQDRVTELLENGMGFSGSYYTIGETISMDVVTLKAMKDEEFTGLLDKVRVTNRDILEAKRKKLQDEQDERDRLQKQKDEQAETERKQQAAQALIDEGNRKLAEQKKKFRTDRLQMLGMNLDYSSKTFQFKAENDRVFMWLTFVETSEDEKFDQELEKLSSDIVKLKQKAQEAADNRKKEQDAQDELDRLAREKQIRTNGREMDIFTMFGARKEGDKYIVRSKVPGSQASMGILKTTVEDLDDKAWANAVNESKKVFKKFQAEQEKEQKRLDDAKEAKRQAAMGDGEKIHDIIGRMSQHALKAPELTSEDGKAIWKKFDEGFAALIEAAEDAINRL